jgi:putative IMPACT (imprinted ancient) family translation regulator
MAVENAGVCIAQRSLSCRVRVSYETAGAVEYFLKHGPCRLEETTYDDGVAFHIVLRQDDREALSTQVANLTAGQAEWEDTGSCYLCWD